MALIDCPECGSKISDKAVSCPQCGFPIIQQTINAQTKVKSLFIKPIVGEIKKTDAIEALVILMQNLEGNKETKLLQDYDKCFDDLSKIKWAEKYSDVLFNIYTIDNIALVSDDAQSDYLILKPYMDSLHRMAETLDRMKKKKEKNESEKDVYELWLYMLNTAFSELKPKEEEYFGAIEMCEYLNKKYNMGNKMNSAVGFINDYFFNLQNAKRCTTPGDVFASDFWIRLKNGKTFSYEPYYYINKGKEEINEKAETMFLSNPTTVIETCLEFAKAKRTDEDQHIGKSAASWRSINASMEEMRQAKEKFVSVVKNYQAKNKNKLK